MRYSIIATCLSILFCLVTSQLQAGILVTAQGPAAPVAPGSLVTFNIFLSPNNGTEIVDLIDMNAIAGPGDGTAGVFTTASQLFLLTGVDNDDFDVGGTPGQAFSTNFGSATITIDSTLLYGRLILDTTGVSDGTYLLSFDQLAAVNTNLQNAPEIIMQHQGFSYTIQAIPEPSMIVTLVAIGGIAVVRRRISTGATRR